MRPPRPQRRRWERLRRVALDRDGWRCRKCGKAGRLEVDHITPWHRGGDYWDMANLQALCRPCHFAKTSSEFRRVPTGPWADMVNELLPPIP